MIVFDTEATDLTKPDVVPLDQQPYLVEFAGIKVDSKTLKEQSRLEFMCNPGLSVLPDDFKRITGIIEADVKDLPSFAAFYPKLVAFFLGERDMAAHNMNYDRDVLKFTLMRIDRLMHFPWPSKHICTVEASQGIKGYRLNLGALYALSQGKELPAIKEHGKGKKQQSFEGAHRAMKDAEVLLECVRWLRKEGHL